MGTGFPPARSPGIILERFPVRLTVKSQAQWPESALDSRFVAFPFGKPVSTFPGNALVLRFRRSHHVAAHSLANVGIKRSTRRPMILVRFLNLKFLGGLAAK